MVMTNRSNKRFRHVEWFIIELDRNTQNVIFRWLIAIITEVATLNQKKLDEKLI